MNVYAQFYSSNTLTGYIRIEIDGNETLLGAYSSNGTYNIDKTISITTGGTHTAKLIVEGGRNMSYYCAFSFNYSGNYGNVYWTGKVKPINGKGIPTETKAIGNLSGINLFGKNLTNSSYKEFFAGLETTTATAGSITPGNFVGYLKIGDYKIPYYK